MKDLLIHEALDCAKKRAKYASFDQGMFVCKALSISIWFDMMIKTKNW